MNTQRCKMIRSFDRPRTKEKGFCGWTKHKPVPNPTVFTLKSNIRENWKLEHLEPSNYANRNQKQTTSAICKLILNVFAHLINTIMNSRQKENVLIFKLR